MSADRELLEAAARAAGYRFHGHRKGPDYANCYVSTTGDTDDWFIWSPLTDDGDALRLAVKLRFHINIFSATSSEGIDSPGFVEIWDHDTDPLHVEWVKNGDYEAATRRAIVRAAAAIGGAK